MKNKEKLTETRNINILTRSTDWKTPCLYIHLYQIIKNRGPGPYNSLRYADNRKYFSGCPLSQNRREAHMIYMVREVGKIWRCSCWEKGNFVMINKFKYGQTWKIWPSPLSLSLYSTFNNWHLPFLNVPYSPSQKKKKDTLESWHNWLLSNWSRMLNWKGPGT